MSAEAKQFLENAAAGAAADAKKAPGPNEPTSNASYKAPGRLGDPSMEVKDDPRINSKLLATISHFGMDRLGVPPGLETLKADSTLEDIAGMIEKMEKAFMYIYNGAIPLDLPGDKDEPKVEQTEQTIKGGDGQDMKVYIYRPADQGNEKLPAVLYNHGGGMTILTTFNPVHDRWCRSIAANGAVVILVDFRNAWTKENWHPFPAGLNDCSAAVRWAFANKNDLKIGNIMIQGESGGGNLTLATALKAQREGWLDEIAGVYALCPAISNLFGASEERKLKKLPSMIENYGYFLNSNAMAFMGFFYAPKDGESTNPLAWPYHATAEDMTGLPPHVLVMDELDLLRDEGVSYARRLEKAGVPTKSSVNMGTLHGTSLLFRQAVPALHQGIARDIATFAKQL